MLELGKGRKIRRTPLFLFFYFRPQAWAVLLAGLDKDNFLTHYNTLTPPSIAVTEMLSMSKLQGFSETSRSQGTMSCS